MPGRRLLVVSYMYPPSPHVGAHRWAALTTYLRRLGHDVTVLASSAFGRLPDDEAAGVVRTGDLVADPRLRRALRRRPLEDAGAPSPGRRRGAPPDDLLRRVLVPDPYVLTWVPGAIRAAGSLVRERDIECVITSSPYESTHLVGLALRGRDRRPWIADLRDGWRFERLRAPYATCAQEALDARLERLVASRADRVVAATEPIAADARARLGVDAACIPNAWDPDLEAEVEPATPAGEAARFVLAHTGKLNHPPVRDPGPLFAALDRLASEDGVSAETFRVVLAGPADGHETLLDGRPGAALVEHAGHLPRGRALGLQRGADALLLLTSPRGSEATGKLFEYLAAGRPILALAGDNEAARLVRETGTGVVVAPDDPVRIADVLRAALRGELAAAYAPRGLERYAQPAPALAMAEEVERAIATREGTPPPPAERDPERAR